MGVRSSFSSWSAGMHWLCQPCTHHHLEVLGNATRPHCAQPVKFWKLARGRVKRRLHS